MARVSRIFPLAAAIVAAGCAVPLWAQPAGGSPILNPSATQPTAPTAPRRHRALSPEVASQLSAATPKFAPAPPKPAATPEEEQPDLRDIDKPRNGIIRLPKYVVREPRPAVLSERDVNTAKGLADLAVRRYMSEADRALNRFTLPLFGSSMQSRALLMYQEDERLQNMSDLNANAADAAKSDPAAGSYIRREAQKTFMRTPDFGYQGGGAK